MYKKSDDYPNDAFLCRFMLDYKYIGKGLGKASFSTIISYLKTIGMTSIRLGLDEENVIAKQLYTTLGFSFTGKIIDDEHIYMLNL